MTITPVSPYHACIVALGTALLTVDWNIYLEFALLRVATSGGALVIHRFLVMRYAPMEMARFDGKACRMTAP